MVAAGIIFVIVIGLTILWAINTSIDALIHKGSERLTDRRRANEVNRIRNSLR